jgi:TIR domain
LRIFLSYRRDDSSAWAGRLRDALAARFGEENIFQDVVAVRPGQTFTDAIDAALATSDAVLAVIGPRWLTSAGSDGEPRLAKSDDYLRTELTAALAQTKQLIPVLVGGAAMPTTAQLPESLKPLGLRQAVVLRDASWHQDVDGLIRSLRGEPPTRQRRRWLPAAGAAAALLAAGATVWLLLDHGGATSSSSSEPSSGSATRASCPGTSSRDWRDLGVAATTDVGGPTGIRFAVSEGHYRAQGSGRWYLVLRSEATNQTNATQTHYRDFYKLEADGITFEPDCFSVVGGQNPMDPGRSSDVLVGFETTRDPKSGFSLGLDTHGEFGRVELLSTTAG